MAVVGHILDRNVEGLANESSNDVTCPVCGEGEDGGDDCEAGGLDVLGDDVHEHDGHWQNLEANLSGFPDEHLECVQVEVADSPVESVVSHDIAVLQASLHELEDERSKDELPDLYFRHEGHVEHNTGEDADRLENVHHVVLGLSDSALVEEEIELEVLKLWQHHTCYEEEGEGIRDLSVLECIGDELDVQAEFFVVCHLALWSFIVEFEKSGFFGISILLLSFRNRHV